MFTIPKDLLDRRDRCIAAYCGSYEAILRTIHRAKGLGAGTSRDYPEAVRCFRRAAQELGEAEEAIRRFPIREYARLKRENEIKRALALERRRRESHDGRADGDARASFT